MTHSSIPVLDFGGQTAQLLVRRVRELGVYSELVPYDAPEEVLRKLNPLGLILWGPLSALIGISAALWVACALLLVSSLAMLSVADIRRLTWATPSRTPAG